MPPVKILTDQNELVPTRKVRKALATFPFKVFNPVQSRIFEVYKDDANCIIAAATSAGKTVAAELYMAHEVRKRGGKAMYLAPLKALAKEKIDDWTSPDHHFNDLSLSICTGDYQLTAQRKAELAASDLILMTSEMLNSRCRNFKSERNDFLKEVGTIVVDESHLLTVPGRGDKLEVGLMKFSQIAPHARIVFLSATMPNVKEIAEWVSYQLTGKETYLLQSDYRPCPLGIHYEKHWVGKYYDDTEGEKVAAAMRILQDYEDDKFLIFVHTKRTGALMKSAVTRAGIECEFHSADLDKDKREALEKRFRKGSLRVVVATSTLAWGCCAYGTKIQMADGTLKKIEEVKPDDSVLSLDGDFRNKKVLRVGDNTSKNGLKVTLKSGEECIVSLDHEFYAANGRNVPDWIRSVDLKLGDFIAVPSCYDFDVKIGFSVLGYLLGYVAGDGSLVDAGVHADGSQKVLLDIAVGNMDKDHLEVIREWLSELADYDIPEIRTDLNGVWHIQCKARGVCDIFKPYFSTGRKFLQSVPLGIQKDRLLLRSFLMGLIDADGGVEDHSNGNWSVGLTNISEAFIKEVQQLLLVFGVRSSVGKKKMKNVTINGRLQKAVREYCWRLRIYNKDIIPFHENIGFKIPRKQRKLQGLIDSGFKPYSDVDLLPARDMILHHAQKSRVSPRKMCESVGIDLWNSLHQQDLKRETVSKILQRHPADSSLKKLYDENVLWKRIAAIEPVTDKSFRDIEVEGSHNYVGNGIISHNCNLPARRVIVVGVHRGINAVDSYDIWQMVGRSGRVGLDPRGDAYILLPEPQFDEWEKRLAVPQKITSRLLDYVGRDSNPHYKTLAFHIVSEIHHGVIKNRDDMRAWYGKSLASFQDKDLEHNIVESTVDLLLKYGAIKEVKGQFEAAPIGRVASMFYYSPFDVARLKGNFDNLFNFNQESSDFHVSMALGSTDTIMMGIVSKAERQAMSAYAAHIQSIMKPANDQSVKGGYVYYTLMKGQSLGALAGFGRNLQWDFPRTIAVLKAIDSMSSQWCMTDWFKELQMRVAYGVDKHLLRLCTIPKVGAVRAEKLYKAGIKSPDDFLAKQVKAQAILGLKKETFDTIVTQVKTQQLVS